MPAAFFQVMPRFLPRPVLVILALALLAASPGMLAAQRGALTLPRALDELTQEASLIVHANVISATVEPHPELQNLMTVVVSLVVQETLKGAPGKTLQFRQYIWDMRDQHDAARYAKGQELLLMLGPVSKYGLTSPVGLEQGRFRIARDPSGEIVAVNGRGNVGLFQSTEARAKARGIKLSTRQTSLLRQDHPGPVPLSDLKDAIRMLGAAK
jgi:hypothetical protein